jgi:signal transduction histidine kinase
VPNRAVIEIIDNGSGMSKEFLREKLFKPFQTTKPQGVGLGLSTAAEIIRIHDGMINVMSELKEPARPGGTFVRLIFPGIAPEPENADEDESPEEPAPPLGKP